MAQIAKDRPNIFPALKYKDASAAMKWLGEAFGFRTHFEVPGANGGIAHAELQLGAGMVMLGSEGKPDPANPWTTEQGIYVQVEDVNAHYARAKKARAKIVREIADTDYGAREYSCRDAEGKLWSFGTYLPETGGG